MSQPLLSVVIPSYNRRKNVLALLGDVYRQEEAEFEVIVVDDCSPDGSAEAIAAAFPQATLLINEQNGGPCVTRNRGIRAARGEIIVGFDSDVRLPDGTLLARIRGSFAQEPPAVGFAFRLLKADGITEDRERWWHPLPVAPYAGRAFETSYFSGTAYAFRREPLLAAGLFPEILYMHYEEVVLAFRLLDAGHAIRYAPELVALHGAEPTPRRSRIKVFYRPRSQVLVTVLCYPFWRGCAYLLPRLGYGLLAALRDGYFRDYCSALRSAVALLPKARKARRPLRPETWRRLARLRRPRLTGRRERELSAAAA